MPPQCPICISRHRSPVSLSCKHIFCRSCLTTWFYNSTTCPYCRSNISGNEIWSLNLYPSMIPGQKNIFWCIKSPHTCVRIAKKFQDSIESAFQRGDSSWCKVMFDPEFVRPIILIINFEDSRIFTNLLGYQSHFYAIRDEFEYIE